MLLETVNPNRVLLIAPVVYRGRAYPCVGLGYIGAYLDREEVDVRIVDTNYTGENASEALAAEAPCIVGITCEARNIDEALALAKEAKKGGHVTVLGGLQVSLVRQQMLEHDQVDFAIHGEGEVAMAEFVNALKSGSDYRKVQGLIYRNTPKEVANGKEVIQVGPKATAPRRLDSLPFPAYHMAGITDIPEYPLITSRHCPYECTFCTVGTISTRGQWQKRSAENLVDELIHARRRYNINRFFVADEMFSLDLKRVKKFCRLLIKKKNSMPWGVMEGLRADRVDRELCELFLEAGCDWVVFGIETVDPEVFEGITKGETISKVHDAIAIAKEAGIKVGGYFVVGLPNSTYERDLAAIEYVKSANLDNGVFWMANPYLGTPMHSWVVQNAKILRSPTGDNIVNSLSTMPLFEMDHYKASEIKRAHARANLRMGHHSFYYDPHDDSTLSVLRHWLRVGWMFLRYDPSSLPRYLLRPGTIKPWHHAQKEGREQQPGWRGWLTQRRPDALNRQSGQEASLRGLAEESLRD
ncbi:B12-binding domain-containing radical SAM protein [Roseibium album]|uniref:B12-binding domain-containing radical SAM protein n=1 Tax=Roseibium album TaxID=311410 RepID=UPI002490DF12|nr:radical SAM protein [Roseibium album]